MNLLLISYFLIGVSSSFLSGLLGIGGGLIIIPSLVWAFAYFHVVPSNQLMHVVIATSLASSIVNLISSVIAHHRKKNIEWPVFRRMSLGILLGAFFLGPAIMLILSGNTLKAFFGIICFIFSIQMILPKKNKHEETHLPGNLWLSTLSLLIGTLSVILGLAGGVMVATTLNHYSMNMRKVIGTTASVALLLSLSGTLSLMLISEKDIDGNTGLINWLAFLFIALPSPFFSPLGAKVAQKLPIPLLKKIFAGLIFIIGIKMLLPNY